MASQVRNFLVSTADFLLYYNDILVCTGYTNLNASIEVSMQEQNVNAGKGNKLVYSYKYGRELNISLEAADFKLEYIACQVGSKITEGMHDVYKMGECVQLTNGIGVVGTTPIGDVAVELPDGNIVTVTPDTLSIDLTAYGLTNESVKATYQYSRLSKRIVIDADSSPAVFRLVLNADRHNSKIGKVGNLEIVVPSYQPSGNFTIDLTPDGVSATSIDGKAIAVEGENCKDGSGVYAYITEYDDIASALAVTEIVATPAVINLDSADTATTATISVVGLKGELYNPIELANADCNFVSDEPGFADVGTNTGIVTAVATGTANITVTYDGKEDTVQVIVA